MRIRPAIPSQAAALDVGRLVALRDSSGRDLALGVVAAVGPKRVGIITPLAGLSRAKVLVTGGLRLDAATGGEEVGNNI
jgi:hypothetical protein